MKLHRFYVHDTELEDDFWLRDKQLHHQWTRVLRFDVGREVVLFNDKQEEKLYKIASLNQGAVQLQLMSERESKTPKNEIYLCFSLLKKDKNQWILQKATELGVRHFFPLITARTEKTGFDSERAEKIVIEAAEQCGRTDIPTIHEPANIEIAIKELSGTADIYVAQEGSDEQPQMDENSKAIAVFVGPEGGWSEKEKELFTSQKLRHVQLGDFTLRAETACIVAAATLIIEHRF